MRYVLALAGTISQTAPELHASDAETRRERGCTRAVTTP